MTQGSTIGLLLFTLYVTDFPGFVDNAAEMYADDSTIHSYVKDIKAFQFKRDYLCNAVTYIFLI